MLKLFDKIFVDICFHRDDQKRVLFTPYGVFSKNNYILKEGQENKFRQFMRLNVLVSFIILISLSFLLGSVSILKDEIVLILLLGVLILNIAVVRFITRGLSVVKKSRATFIKRMSKTRIRLIIASSTLLSLMLLLSLFVAYETSNIQAFISSSILLILVIALVTRIVIIRRKSDKK